jgi:hypothetical protein
MWFSMPEGCGGITVECQEFGPEVKDEKGVASFRAPDHFAPRILAITGFAVATPPEGAPDDLPRADPLRDGAIAELTALTESQKTEIQNLRSDLNAASARTVALKNENTDLRTKLEQTIATAAGLQEQLEDNGSVVELKTAGKSK